MITGGSGDGDRDGSGEGLTGRHRLRRRLGRRFDGRFDGGSGDSEGDGLGEAVRTGALNLRRPSSKFIASVASRMNCCQIGPAWVDPNTCELPVRVMSGAPSFVPTHTAAAKARV